MSNKYERNTGPQGVQIFIKQAEALFADNKVDEALALLEETENNYPDVPKVPSLIGKYTADKKSRADGIKKLESVLTRFPDHLDSLLELGNIHLRPGDVRSANPYFHKALELAPDNPGAHMGMGALNQRKGDLPLAVENYRKAIELQLKFPIADETPEPKADFRVTDAENLLWDTLMLMADNGIHMFPIFGTMLGIIREGGLLLHDKDIDTGIPHSEMLRTVRILQHNGWREINGSVGYSNPRAMLNIKTGISMDISGFVIDDESGKALTAGAWIPGVPKEWNMIWEFEQIALEKRPTTDGKHTTWFIKDPESWLETLYGDWKTPDKNFDTMVCAKNLRSFSLLAKCFAYSRVFDNWTKNNIPRALSLTRAALTHEPNDALLKRVLSRLEDRRK